MSSTFGSRLRAHREQEQISLDDVAARTKIRLSLLEALERDDISQWPRGLRRRSYVRSYAHAVGLDPETTVREFLALYPEPIEQVDEPAAAATTTDSGLPSHRPRTSLQTLVQSVVGTFVRPRRPPEQTGVPASNVLARQSTDDPASSSRFQLDANDREPEVVHRSRTMAEQGSEVVLLPMIQIDVLDNEFLSEAEHPGLVRRHAPQAAAPPDSVREVADTSSPSTDTASPAAEKAVPGPNVPDAASAL